MSYMKVCFGCGGIELKTPLTKSQICGCTLIFPPAELFFIHNLFEKIIPKRLKILLFPKFFCTLFSGCSPLLMNIVCLKSNFSSLKRSRGCLSIFSAIEDTMVGCAMLGLSKAFFVFDLIELCEVLDLAGKTVERHTEFHWTSSVA